jgi:hypothetical protein
MPTTKLWLMISRMIRKKAHERGLDLTAFTSMEAALRYACAHRTYMYGAPFAVTVFREEIAHFDVFFVGTRPLPPIKKFHERII